MVRRGSDFPRFGNAADLAFVGGPIFQCWCRIDGRRQCDTNTPSSENAQTTTAHVTSSTGSQPLLVYTPVCITGINPVFEGGRMHISATGNVKLLTLMRASSRASDPNYSFSLTSKPIGRSKAQRTTWSADQQYNSSGLSFSSWRGQYGPQLHVLVLTCVSQLRIPPCGYCLHVTPRVPIGSSCKNGC